MMGLYKDKLTSLFSKKDNISSLSVLNAGYTVIDTELTGLDLKKDSIVSVGAVKMNGGRIEIGSSFYWLVKPSNGISHNSVIIHGITPSDVTEKPPIDTVLPEFTDYCGEDIIIGHFVSLDVNFINRELKRLGRTPLINRLLDTYRIYEWIRSNEGAFSRHYTGRKDELDLYSLAREYGISVSEGHNALGDAFITAQLFQRFLNLLPGLGVKNARDLLRIGRP